MAITKEIIIKADTSDAVTNIDDLGTSIEGVGDDAVKTSKQVSGIQKASNGAAKGFKAIGTAFKAIGIGLVVALFAKLAEILGKNQKAMDFFSNVMTGLEIAFKDLYGFVTQNFLPAFERLKSFFDNLTFDQIKNAIKENIIERFNSVLEVLGFVGEAFKKLFEGDFKGALNAVKEAGKEMVDVITGVDGTVDKVTDAVVSGVTAMTNYAKETYNAADAITELNNQALIAEAVNRGLIEQYDRQAEQLRQIRDDESASIEDRIAANDKLAEVLNEQEEIMLKNADIAIQAAANNLAVNDTIENQVALIDAQNEKLGIQAQIEGFRSEQLVNTNGLLREKNEIEQAALDLLTEKELAEAEAIAKKKAADEKAAADEIALAKTVQEAKVSMTVGTLGRISQLTEQNSKLGKATAAAAALINTYQGITAELATKTVTPFEFGLKLVNIATTAAIGFKSVKDILKTNPKSAGSAGGGSVGGGGGQSAPAFNLVAGTGSSQIANSIQSQDNVQRSYVVSSDQTTAAAIDRNIVAGSQL